MWDASDWLLRGISMLTWHGNAICVPDAQLSRTDLQGEASDDRLAFAHVAGRAVALGEVRAGHFRPTRVFQVE